MMKYILAENSETELLMKAFTRLQINGVSLPVCAEGKLTLGPVLSPTDFALANLHGLFFSMTNIEESDVEKKEATRSSVDEDMTVVITLGMAENAVGVKVGGAFLDRLMKAHGGTKGFSLKVTMSDFLSGSDHHCCCWEVFSCAAVLSTKDMELQEESSNLFKQYKTFCQDVFNMSHFCDETTKKTLIRNLRRHVTRAASVMLTIELHVRDVSIAWVNCNEKILEGVATDAVIVAENGAEIKCLKAFLVGNSDVLKAMFESGMQEGQTGKINMDDMSEEAVKSFISFIYYADVRLPLENPFVALELLKASEKYGITLMKNMMERIFLAAAESWWTVDLALAMYFFVRNIPSTTSLQRKAAQILQKNSSNLSESENYQKLFLEDPKGAMEFTQFVLSHGMNSAGNKDEPNALKKSAPNEREGSSDEESDGSEHRNDSDPEYYDLHW